MTGCRRCSRTAFPRARGGKEAGAGGGGEGGGASAGTMVLHWENERRRGSEEKIRGRERGEEEVNFFLNRLRGKEEDWTCRWARMRK